MGDEFNEHDKKGKGILVLINTMIEIAEIMFSVHFKQPRYVIARRILNEITEFEAEDE
jgi:hypothetical protein